MKSIRSFLLVLAISSSCLEPFSFQTENAGGQLVIYGKISSRSDQTRVSIGRVTEPGRPPIFINDAIVSVVDDLGAGETFIAVGRGEYVYAGNKLPEPEKRYRLIVNHNNKTYVSSFESLPADTATGRSHFKYRDDQIIDREGTIRSQPVVDVFSDIVLPERSSFFRLVTEETFIIRPTDFPDFFNSIPPDCFVTLPVESQNIILLDGRSFKSRAVTGWKGTTREIDQSFLIRHYFSVYVESLTSSSFQYWQKVQQLISQTGSLFDIPPGQLAGNIICLEDPNEQVRGLFEITNTTVHRFFVLPSDLPVFISDPCPYDPSKLLWQYPDKCLDCANMEGSSIFPPLWWR